MLSSSSGSSVSSTTMPPTITRANGRPDNVPGGGGNGFTDDLTDVRTGPRCNTGGAPTLPFPQSERCPSSADVGQQNGPEELVGSSKLPSNPTGSSKTSKQASLAELAGNGFRPAQTCVKDLDVTRNAIDALKTLVSEHAQGAGSDPVRCASVIARVNGLVGCLNDVASSASKLLNAKCRHIEKHGDTKSHADRTVHAPKGGELARRYEHQASRITREIKQATKEVQQLLGGDKAKASWGEFLFEALVEKVVIPADAARKPGPTTVAWEQVDFTKYYRYRATCKSFDNVSKTDPFAFIAEHLAQGFSVLQAPTTDQSAQVNGTPERQRLNGTSNFEDFDDRDAISFSEDGVPIGSTASSNFDDSFPSFSRTGNDQAGSKGVGSGTGGGVGVGGGLGGGEGIRPDAGVDQGAPLFAGATVNDSHDTHINIMGDINVNINIGHGATEVHTDHFVRSAGINGVAFPPEVLHSRWQTTRAVVNAALDQAEQRAGSFTNTKAGERLNAPFTSGSNRSVNAIARNGEGRFYLDREPISELLSNSPGQRIVSENNLFPDFSEPDLGGLENQKDAKDAPLIINSVVFKSSHVGESLNGGPRATVLVDASKPRGGLETTLTRENFFGPSSVKEPSGPTSTELPLKTARLQPPPAPAPTKSAPEEQSLPAPTDTIFVQVPETPDGPTISRIQRTASFRELAQTPMSSQVADSVKDAHAALSSQIGKIEAAAFKERVPRSPGSGRAPWPIVEVPYLQGKSVAFGLPRFAQPEPTVDPGRFMGTGPAQSRNPSSATTLIATNRGRQLDVRSTHLKAANPTKEMQLEWDSGVPRPLREALPGIRS